MFDHVHVLTKGLTQSERTRLQEMMSEREFPAGEMLCREGTSVMGLMVMTAGQASVCKRDAKNQEQTLAKLEAPTILGELELVSGDPCSASVIADTAVVVNLLTTDEFDRLVNQGDSMVTKLVRNIARIVVRRLMSTNARYVDMMNWDV